MGSKKASSAVYFLRISAVCLLLAAVLATARFALKRSLQTRISCDPRFRISQLIEIPKEQISLRSGTIEDFLDLKGKEQNLFAFDIERAREALLANPLIEKAQLWRCPPSALTVAYRVRRPFAELKEWPDLLLDDQGYLFPHRPHFTPKQLPKLILGLPIDAQRPLTGLLSCRNKGKIGGKRAELGLQILLFVTKLFQKEGTRVEQIDVSSAFASNLGERSVYLILEDHLFIEGNLLICQRHLRLSCEEWPVQLNRYRRLLMTLAGKEMRALQNLKIKQQIAFPKKFTEEIDLRLPQLAFFNLRLVQQSREF